MAYGIEIEDAREVELYRFGRSKQVFRGPKPDLSKPYFAFIGGSEPFGKFVREPFPKLVENRIKQTCVNLSTPGAGPGFYLRDPVVLETCSLAKICVVQVMSAAQLSNRMYSVYPRRNMRLRGVSGTLRALYPQMDFSKFKYVSALIPELRNVNSEAYKIVLAEQQSAWMARMLELLQDVETRKILLWIKCEKNTRLDQTVTDRMVDALSSHVDSIITVRVSAPCKVGMGPAGSRKDTDWMTREVHAKVAKAVSAELLTYQQQKRPA